MKPLPDVYAADMLAFRTKGRGTDEVLLAGEEGGGTSEVLLAAGKLHGAGEVLLPCGWCTALVADELLERGVGRGAARHRRDGPGCTARSLRKRGVLESRGRWAAATPRLNLEEGAPWSRGESTGDAP